MVISHNWSFVSTCIPSISYFLFLMIYWTFILARVLTWQLALYAVFPPPKIQQEVLPPPEVEPKPEVKPVPVPVQVPVPVHHNKNVWMLLSYLIFSKLFFKFNFTLASICSSVQLLPLTLAQDAIWLFCMRSVFIYSFFKHIFLPD